MSNRDRSLDDALDALPDGKGTVGVHRGDTDTEVDVVDTDRLGVKVRSVRVGRERPVDVVGEARRLPDDLRSLPDRIAPVEVDPALGGAKLRTRPDELRGGEFFEVDVEPRQTTIRRTRVGDDGGREPAEWTLTRDQLDRLIDEASGT
jgi:hypothetical protein